MSTHREGILRKIRGLLAQAENPACTIEEAETFAGKAEELITKYAIDLALLEAEAGTETAESRRVDMTGKYGRPKVTLLDAIARHFRCRVVMFRTGKSVFPSYCIMAGYPSDMDAVELLYTSLLLQMTNAMLHTPTPYGYSAAQVMGFRTSFCYGYAVTVNTRLKDIAARALRDFTPGTGLVLRDRALAAEELIFSLLGKVEKSKTRIRDGRGYNGGRVAGESADLDHNKIGNTRKELG